MTAPQESSPAAPEEARRADFIRERVRADREAGKHGGAVLTRFPPEPNGYLHIGHAKSICLNFGLAREVGGRCNLRFDDTNPSTEDEEYVHSIQADVRWLGFEWDALYYASDYFAQLYAWAEELVTKGQAYVCDLGGEELREGRGAGKNSPYRERGAAENLELLRRMRAGEFADGARTLRAKIDMAAPNMNLRDPVMYRILRAPHHRTGNTWCLYPTYDWAHGESDALEGITHSICTLEFENHRPLYEWFLRAIGVAQQPQQIEFARLNLTYTVLSKRKLLRLVKEGRVSGWDDPRMPTLSGLRRRGYTPEALRLFCERIGVAKFNSTVDMVQLENALRDDLNKRAPRVMVVLNPLRVVIENYPAGEVEWLEAVNNPEDPAAGTRKVPFGRELFIEREDFRSEAPKNYWRLKPGQEVRLRYGYYVTCTGFELDAATGEPVLVRVRYDPATRGGDSPDKRKVKGTLHWVSAAHALEADVRLCEHLFRTAHPEDVPAGVDFLDNLNPDSLRVLTGCKLEPSLATATAEQRYQFERHGYFCLDARDSRPEHLLFQRAVALRDTWAKLEHKEGAPK
ncbi:MAG: glutamine--tRNA ligase/YqeY domain fusion protein [Planctomycetes bacterium]|nr:glutamine--tRNA ligase/YqeY domain fusion protein [Planctomycetota bacterium]